MPNKYNPFRPDKLVKPGMFAGRLEELHVIDQALLQTKHENPQHLLIEGERGIGKSSLLLCAELVARGNIATITDKNVEFIVVGISLQEKDDACSIIKRIGAEFEKEIGKKNPAKKFALKAASIISRIEAAGVKFRREELQRSETELVSALAADIQTALLQFGDSIDGVLVLIDEADRPPPEANLGATCKLLTEEMTRTDTDRLCIVLAGLPGLINKLRESHESSPRIFRILSLSPLEDEFRHRVINSAMNEAEKKNGFSVEITDEARTIITQFSEGYPHFLQEFGYAAFEADDDNNIDKNDVINSLFSDNGAFCHLGKKYFNQYYTSIVSDDYRLVLHGMADDFDGWVDRSTIIQRTGLKQGTVDNALRALKQKNVIQQHEERRGHYRLPTRSFAVWIRMRSESRKDSSNLRIQPSGD